MVLFNYATKELTAKIVYYGPGLCGKTTNLQWIHTKLPIKNKGKMLSLATETDRTLFFDFLPIELGNIRGMRTRMQLYTVPGQVFYNATRRMVLKGADCVIFVADSQEPMLDPNLESLENLRQNLEANEITPDSIPLLFQFNKRDLPNALPVEILNDRLNPKNLPYFEAVAIRGDGVEQTLKAATSQVFRYLSTKYSGAAAPGADVVPATGPSRLTTTGSNALSPSATTAVNTSPGTIAVPIPAVPPAYVEPAPNLRTIAPMPSPGTQEVAPVAHASVDGLDPGQTLERTGDEIEELQQALRQSNPVVVTTPTTAEVPVPVTAGAAALVAAEAQEVIVPVDISLPAGTTAVRLRLVLNVSIKLDDPR